MSKLVLCVFILTCFTVIYAGRIKDAYRGSMDYMTRFNCRCRFRGCRTHEKQVFKSCGPSLLRRTEFCCALPGKEAEKKSGDGWFWWFVAFMPDWGGDDESEQPDDEGNFESNNKPKHAAKSLNSLKRI